MRPQGARWGPIQGGLKGLFVSALHTCPTALRTRLRSGRTRSESEGCTVLRTGSAQVSQTVPRSARPSPDRPQVSQPDHRLSPACPQTAPGQPD
ncbi:unnamed protein product [Gadus morhua 'NCC']